MKKILLITIAFSLSMLLCSASASTTPAPAENMAEAVGGIHPEISISASGRQLHVTGANGQEVRIYNVVGTFVAKYKIASDDFKVEITGASGIYIVKVGQISRRIIINDK